MKNKILLLLFAGIFSQGLSAQMNVSLHLHQKMGDQPFALNQAASAPGGYSIKFTRLQYYVSEIEIIHDGGQVTPAEDVHLLVSAQSDSLFKLGLFDVENIEGIRFSIGVDPSHNHLDPSTYPAEHPLAHQNPSMHWGWTAGYRFIALEGKSSNNGTTFPDDFQIHTIDDVNYKTVTLDVEGVLDVDHLVVHVDADYCQMLNGINVQGGLISHAANGASADVADNMEEHVFTPTVLVNGISEPDVAGAFSVSPNPVGVGGILSFDLAGKEGLTLMVTDLAGRTVCHKDLPGPAQSLSVQASWQPGLYFASIFSGGRRLAVEKFLVK